MNCISTEFTPKKHGGEKGVPFRLVIETYPYNGKTPSSCLHAASCQVKVFKPKGADRKHKTDREKLGKRPQMEQEKFQPSYECTVFTDCPLESFSFSSCSSSNNSQNCNPVTASPASTTATTSTSTTSSIQDSKAIKSKIVQEKSPKKPSPIPETELMLDLSNSASNISLSTSIHSNFGNSYGISSESDANETSKWLHQNRFGNFTRTFSNFSGADILRLTRDDLIQICGLTDGIRLYNALHFRAIRPRLTLYVCSQSDEVFRAIYLENLTYNELVSKLSSCLSSNTSINRVCICGPSAIKILVTDEVVRNLSDESMYIIELSKGKVN